MYVYTSFDSDSAKTNFISNCSYEKKENIIGVVGAASSVTSIQVANLLRLFKIPQVKHFSCGADSNLTLAINIRIILNFEIY